jgi:hypothetical protein
VDLYARIVAQPFVQLTMAHIDGDHLCRAALKHAVGESARRRASIEDSLAVHVDPEPIERAVQLVASTTHEPGRRSAEADRFPGTHQPGGIRRRSAAHDDVARFDRISGLLVGRDQTPANELRLEPPSGGRG